MTGARSGALADADARDASVSGPTVAVFSPLLAGSYFAGVMRGIRSRAAGTGTLLVGIQTLDASRDLDYPIPELTTRVAWRHLDGAIVVINAVDLGYLRELRRAGKPIVMVSHEIDGFACPVVSPDNRPGVEAAVAHLVEHGHRRIAFAGNLAQHDIRERHEAYRDALSAHGIAADERLLYDTGDNVEAGGDRAAAAMLAAGLPSTALVAATDFNAIGVMRTLAAAGLTVPGDQAVVGFDDVEAGAVLTPGLTSVRQDGAAVGTRALELLLGALAGKDVPARRHRVPTTLVLRESCGCTLLGSPAASPRALAVPAIDAVRTGLAKVLASGGRYEADELPDTTSTTLAGLLAAPRVVAQGDLDAVAELLCGRTGRWSRVHDTITCVRLLADELDEEHPEDALARARLVTDIALALTATQGRVTTLEAKRLSESLRDEYRMSFELLRSQEHNPRDLGFLARTRVRLACLGLWPPSPTAAGPGRAIDVASFYARDDQDVAVAPSALEVESFPPPAFLDLASSSHGEIVVVLPLRTATADWGLLALVGPLEDEVASGRDFYFQLAALLASALEHDATVTSLRRQTERLGRSEQRYALAATATSDGLFDWDVESDSIFYSRRFCEIAGETTSEASGDLDASPRWWYERVHPDDLEELLAAVDRCLLGSTSAVECEHRIRRPDGAWTWVHCRGLAVPGAPAPARRIVGSLADVTERRKLEEQLRHQALHDPLTGLANRALLLDRAEQMLAAARRHGGTCAALFLDLDDFKEINDGLGHSAGDELLVAVGERLATAARAADTVGRLGGDEFVVLVEQRTTPGAAVVLAERLHDAMSRPFQLRGRDYEIAASIGIATARDGSAEEMLRDADVAMYQAKSAGKDRWVVFTPEMRTALGTTTTHLRHPRQRPGTP
jgi:diguanylate cyclase (GGDEF)-like protein/PAS domain S-box-containing protein